MADAQVAAEFIGTRQVRVRIAPSPTGLPHIGTFRTILFNWLFARRHGGVFIFRIEDTDRERFVPGATDALLDAVEWIGLDWDEGPRVGGGCGPYVQSERLPIYHEHADRLLAEGKAYRCYCSAERLDALRREQQARKQPPGYDRLCRSLTQRERAEREAGGAPSVVRFAVPLEGSTTFHDVIHGDVTWENRVLDDYVILKSDGYPTYHLAHLVDDHVMNISHVLRGDEWIPSTPRHVLLYQAFGWEPPLFAHLPSILGPDRKKLSKRHGPTGIAAFQEAGYLPEALLNYLALCGWSSGTEDEVLSLGELVHRFSLDRVNRTGAIFDHAKLDWFNGIWIRSLSSEDLARRMRPFLGGHAAGAQDTTLEAIAALLQERLPRLADARDQAEYFFTDHLDYDPNLLLQRGMSREQALHALSRAATLAGQVEPFAPDTLEPAFDALTQELGLRRVQIFMSIRVACTGREASPPLFGTMAVLGRERVVTRLHEAVARLSGDR